MCCDQHLVKDQRVLKLVQRLAALEEEGGTRSRRQVADDWDELTAYVSLHTTSNVHSACVCDTANTVFVHIHVHVHVCVYHYGYRTCTCINYMLMGS